MSALRNIAIGLGLGVTAFLGYGWYKARQAKNAAQQTCTTPLTVDELQSPQGQVMMQLYARCVQGQCTQAEQLQLMQYLNSLCPDNNAEALWLQSTKDSLKNVAVAGTNEPLGKDPRYARYFHVAGCGCQSCAAKTGHEEPCCEACANGMPCTGACALKQRKEPQAVGRA